MYLSFTMWQGRGVIGGGGATDASDSKRGGVNEGKVYSSQRHINKMTGMPVVIHRNTVIAHHLVLSGYGHWFANDVRGSGSRSLRDPKFADLGPIHPGRKARQPSREELRKFCSEAARRLNHAVLWLDAAQRSVIADALAEAIARRRYTVWACAVLRDHVHLCVRVHRDDYLTMREALATATRDALCGAEPAFTSHPVWSERPYSVYLKSPRDVWRVVRYVEGNPAKHGLPPQRWDFVRPYDDWPLHEKGRPSR